MDSFAKNLFSMRMMALGLFIFLLAIGAATFIESVYDIQTAKLLIYNALWFEILLVFLSITLIANIFRYEMYKREKIASLTFHVSFLVIMIGAAITRFVSFEGLMLIREGSSSNFIYTSDPYLWFRINDGKVQYSAKQKMFQSDIYHNNFDFDVDFPKHKTPISIEFVDFKQKMVDSLVVNDTIQGKVLDIVTGGMSSNYMAKGGFVLIEDIAMSFEDQNAMPGIKITEEKGKLYINSPFDLSYLSMSKMREARENGVEVADSAYTIIPKDTKTVFQTTTLYKVQDQQFVFKGIINHAKKMLMPSGKKDVGSDYLTVKITDGNKVKIVDLEGGMGQIPGQEVFSHNGLTYEMEYGSTRIELPFSIACRDFQLDRYPGSESPSSFASEVTIIDEKNGVKRDKRIFMNNVIDYGGFRFFQSAYDPDEKGTRLSVNHDSWGTNITYLGYLLMAIGMILSLFAPAGHFRDIQNKLKKIRTRKELLSLLFLVSFFSFGQTEDTHNHSDHEGHDHGTEQVDAQAVVDKPVVSAQFMSKEHSEKLATLPIQDFKGRIIPVHTMCDQLLRKLYRKSKYNDLNAVQTIISMHMYPEYWMKEKVIYVYSNLFDSLGVKENNCSFNDISDGGGRFKLEAAYNRAFQKMESKRNEFDKKVIKLGEKFQVCNQIFLWSFMKLVPLKNDAGNRWFIPFSPELKESKSDLSTKALKYLSAIDSCAKSGDFTYADNILGLYRAQQRMEGGKVVPSETNLETEVSYNKMNIFKNASYSYLLVGLALLIIFFIRIFKGTTEKREKLFKKLVTPLKFLLAFIAFYHASGLAMRWYITGHAPWSNGYEAVVFIALVTMIAGFIFSRKNAVVLAATAVLAFLMIFVTEMNLMDPEITPLQPVLKSYWLMIHVAIITGSYGFLGLSAILSLLNLVLYIFRTKENGKHLTLNINELTYVSEMTMTVGLFMLTIGTFLGGIWANESWGRYWGWDPKETWALVSVLVYAIILHLRFIPKLNTKFVFNVVGFWGYSAILFTFFGVNFYLVGLHSYAQGEGLGTIPPGIIITVILFIIFTVLASVMNKRYKAV